MKRTLVIVALLAFVGTSCRTPAKHPGPLPVKGGSSDITVAGSCVETYSPDTLKNREVAFDGVVAGVVESQSPSSVESEGPETSYEVHFTVNRWFKGGSGESATLRSSVPIGDGAVTSADGPSIEKGSRYLVAGDGGFMWTCGFTQVYSDEAATTWSSSLGAGSSGG